MTGPVILHIPADTGRVRLARLLAAAVADDAGFDLDEIEELRLAVDEACFALLDAGPVDGALEIQVEVDGGQVEVFGRCAYSSSPPALVLAELTTRVLGAVTDHHEVFVEGDRGRFRLRKRGA